MNYLLASKSLRMVSWKIKHPAKPSVNMEQPPGFGWMTEEERKRYCAGGKPPASLRGCIRGWRCVLEKPAGNQEPGEYSSHVLGPWDLHKQTTATHPSSEGSLSLSKEVKDSVYNQINVCKAPPECPAQGRCSVSGG